MNKYYRDFGDFMQEQFPGRKMQKLTVDAGFSCPNRDGTIGRGGCSYCNNSSFSPLLIPDVGKRNHPESVSRQLEAGKQFFARKYPEMRYLAYFQSYTNTHGELSRLLALYREALSVDGIDGLIIGTRPDCMPETLLEELRRMQTIEGHWIMIEFGAESSHDETLRRVNRCHSWQQTVDAVRKTTEAGLQVGLHLIMGLPGESRQMMLETIDRTARLPIATLKLHQLQLIRGTRLAADVASGKCTDLPQFTAEEYIELCCDVVELLNRKNPTIAIERFTSQSPADLLISPNWGLKNYQFVNLLNTRLGQKGVSKPVQA